MLLTAVALAALGLLLLQSREEDVPAPPLPWTAPPGSPYAWQPLGPGGGGHIDVFAFGPNYLFVGTDTGGVLRSPDHGETWYPVNRGLYDYPINDLAVDPADPTTLYAATPGGIYKSQDSGDTWTLLRNGFPAKDKHAYSAPIASLAIDPADPDVLYAGSGRLFKRTASQGTGDVWKSTDGGASWARFNLGHPQAVVYALAVDPTESRRVYAATDQGFFLSADAAQNWSQIDARDSRGLALGRDPLTGRTVLYRTVWQEGVLKSADGGRTWSPTAQPPCSVCDYRRIAIHPTDPDTLVIGDYGANARDGGGVFMTTDGGLTWRKLDRFGDLGWRHSPSPLARGLGLNPYRPDELFISSMMVAYRQQGESAWDQIVTRRVSRRGGVSTRWPGRWASRLGNNNTVVNTKPVFHPTQHDTYLLGMSDLYIWRTDDDGRSWQNIQTPGENDVRSLMADPNDPTFRTWFAGDSPQDCCGGALFKTTDGGRSWQQAQGLPDNRVWQVAVVPGDPSLVYAATQDNGLYRSTNGGADFEPRSGQGAASLPLDRLYGVLLDPADPDTLYVPVWRDEGGGLFRSTDGGATWARLGAMQRCTAVAISPVDGTLYAGCTTQLLASSDGGRSWVVLFGEGRHPAHPDQPWAGYINDIAPHPADPRTLCFVVKDDTYHDQSSGYGLWCTTDGGRTWEEIADQLGLVLRGTRVAFHPLPNPETGEYDLFYLTGGGGAYRIRGVEPQE